jgi:catechol 2,3-dioxygenase-like lactoylglutathione lyase family enzyme
MIGRLQRVILAAGLLGALALAGAPAMAASGGAVRGVDSVAIPVTDLERSVEFYTQVLDFRRVGEREGAGTQLEHLLGVFGARVRVARLALGSEAIELVQVLAPRGRPLPVDLHGNDLAFQHVAIIVSDMDRAYARLRANRVEHASTGPQVLPAWNPNAGGIAAFYFRDPDGNFLEVLHFPPGKGQPRWQSPQPLFLGIDHTAVTVRDTDASLRHYRDLLGLEVAGQSENYGPEQEHLNNVFGARLRITALRGAAGPGVELLEYLAPRTGRPIPGDSQANDRWYWQVNFVADDPAAVYRRARAARTTLVSGDVVAIDDGPFGFAQGFVLRDPDGHAAAIATPPAPEAFAPAVRP